MRYRLLNAALLGMLMPLSGLAGDAAKPIFRSVGDRDRLAPNVLREGLHDWSKPTTAWPDSSRRRAPYGGHQIVLLSGRDWRPLLSTAAVRGRESGGPDCAASSPAATRGASTICCSVRCGR